MKRDLPAYVYRIGRGNHPHFRYPRGSKPIRMRAEPGSVEFAREYAVLLSQAKAGKAPAPSRYTMAALIAHYQTSDRWMALKPRTQADYAKVLAFWIEKAGATDPRRIERKHIIAAMEANAATSSRFAAYIVQVAGVLFEHAIDIGWLKQGQNPAHGIRKVKTPKGRKLNRKPWPPELIQAFRDRFGFDTRERLMLELGLGTGQRIADVLGMRWTDIKGDAVEVVQNKTDKELLVPLTDNLRAALTIHRGINQRSTRPSEFILTNEDRSDAWSYRGAAQAFRKARSVIGALDYDIHSMRHAAATELKRAGCSNEQISAVTGMSDAMVRHYTQHTDQEHLARAAAALRAAAEREQN